MAIGGKQVPLNCRRCGRVAFVLNEEWDYDPTLNEGRGGRHYTRWSAGRYVAHDPCECDVPEICVPNDLGPEATAAFLAEFEFGEHFVGESPKRDIEILLGTEFATFEEAETALLEGEESLTG